MAITKFKKLESMAQDYVRMGEQAMSEFTEKLAADPAYAFEWSSRAFQSAAELRVGKTILELLSRDAHEDEKVGWVLEEALDRSLREARDPSHSTSVQSNEMARCVAAAWAKVYDKVERSRF